MSKVFGQLSDASFRAGWHIVEVVVYEQFEIHGELVANNQRRKQHHRRLVHFLIVILSSQAFFRVDIVLIRFVFELLLPLFPERPTGFDAGSQNDVSIALHHKIFLASKPLGVVG